MTYKLYRDNRMKYKRILKIKITAFFENGINNFKLI